MIQVRVLQRQPLSYPCYLFGFRYLTNQCAFPTQCIFFCDNVLNHYRSASFSYIVRILFMEKVSCLVMNSFMTLNLCMVMLSIPTLSHHESFEIKCMLPYKYKKYFTQQAEIGLNRAYLCGAPFSFSLHSYL